MGSHAGHERPGFVRCLQPPQGRASAQSMTMEQGVCVEERSLAITKTLKFTWLANRHNAHRPKGTGRLLRARRRRPRRPRASGCSPPATPGNDGVAPSAPRAMPGMRGCSAALHQSLFSYNMLIMFHEPSNIADLCADRASSAVRAWGRHDVRADDCASAQTRASWCTASLPGALYTR